MLSTAQADGKVLAIYREPFALGSPTVEAWKPGLTVAEIVERMHCLPPGFGELGEVRINDIEVPREHWHLARPRATSIRRPVAVTFHMTVQGGRGGRGGGAKSIIALIAALALTVVTAGISSGLLAPLLGASFLAGTVGSTLLAAGVSLVGALIVGALTSTPSTSANASDATQNNGGVSADPASISGNTLAQNAPIPRVIGSRRVYPTFLFEPITEIIGQDEYVDAVYGLAGPHALSDIRQGGAVIETTANDADISIQIYDGLPGSAYPEYPTRYGRTFPLGVQMSVHGTDPTDLSKFASPLPVFHAMSTADTPDEAWMHLLVQGLIRQADTTQYLRIPFRIRMKQRGTSTWIDFPEVHYIDKTQSQRRIQFKFRWGENLTGTLPTPPATRGFVEARRTVPAQTLDPVGTVFTCDSYFDDGSGSDVYTVATVASTRLQNMSLEADICTFYLGTDSRWAGGIYDIEIKRGAVIIDANYVSSTYMYSGNVWDFYNIPSSNTLPLSRDGVLDTITLTRIVNIKRQEPINEQNLALIYMRVRNRSVNSVSVQAAGYTYDYDGTNWTTLTTTSNPAPHYKDILSGPLNLDPLPDELIDVQGFIDWRQACIDKSYTCNLVTEGASVDELCRIVASCGFANPYQSELWGIIRDYDRSAETPITVFSPRNTNSFKWKKAFPRLPSGLRCNYKDDQYDYAGKQIIVYANGADESDGRTEQITYTGLTKIQDIITRAQFDLLQAQLRATTYSLNVPVESIVCRRGSLVGLNHDVLDIHTGSARIDTVLVDGSNNVVGITLDATVDIQNNVAFKDVTDVLNLTNILDAGSVSAVAIRRTNGLVTVHALSNPTGETDNLTFATPVTNPAGPQSIYDKGSVLQIATGCLVVIGILGRQYKRMIVSDVAPGQDLSATLTLVDEAPGLWS